VGASDIVAAWEAEDDALGWTMPPPERRGRRCKITGEPIIPRIYDVEPPGSDRESQAMIAAMSLLSILPDEEHAAAMQLLGGKAFALPDATRRRLLEWCDALAFACADAPYQLEVLDHWREALR
jgi:hypothetical protein